MVFGGFQCLGLPQIGADSRSQIQTCNFVTIAKLYLSHNFCYKKPMATTLVIDFQVRFVR